MNHGYLLVDSQQQQQNFLHNYYHLNGDGHHHPGWSLENITISFFKCIRWQLEETTDPLNCPYHYYCDQTYPSGGGDYRPIVDKLVLFLTATLYLVTLIFTVQDLMILFNCTESCHPHRQHQEEEEEDCSSSNGGSSRFGGTRRSWWRYWIPSGPIALPFILVSLAKGHHINSATFIGPVLLQVLNISALAFEQPNNAPEQDILFGTIKSILFDMSTISAILHATLYLDAVILPYYTGLDALLLSTSFSGVCVSCVCRKDVLVVGGRLVSYRGWSVTMFSVVVVLCWRILGKVLIFRQDSGANSRRNVMVVTQLIQKTILETASWILIATDCVYLMISSPETESGLRDSKAVYGCACVLIGLHVLKNLQIIRKLARCHYQTVRKVIPMLYSHYLKHVNPDKG